MTNTYAIGPFKDWDQFNNVVTNYKYKFIKPRQEDGKITEEAVTQWTNMVDEIISLSAMVEAYLMYRDNPIFMLGMTRMRIDIENIINEMNKKAEELLAIMIALDKELSSE